MRQHLIVDFLPEGVNLGRSNEVDMKSLKMKKRLRRTKKSMG